MVTLRVVLDAFLERTPRGIARYSEELTRALIQHAPHDCDVDAIVSAVSPDEMALLRSEFPGLRDIHRSPLGRRELRTAWQHGVSAGAPGGMVHAPSLFAPLSRHDRRRDPGHQTVVTIHDAAPWLFPDETGRQAAWLRNMAKRAQKHADAVVVPTHAVAEALTGFVDFGDRIRVIGGAVSARLALPPDAEADAIAERLSLPADYVVALGTLEPRKNLEALLAAASAPGFPDIAVVHIGEPTWGDHTIDGAIFSSGAPTGRVVHLDPLPDHELAVAVANARALIVPSLHEGFGLPAVEAMHLGTPVIHSDTASLEEVVAGAGLSVPLGEPDFPERLADAVARLVGDDALARRLSLEGLDRARAYGWQDSAERTWQLHADL